ncbi:MAG: amino acid-binding protein [Gammaproteobacteria bacterium]|nr:amino acid-binding protein [Gammaproteobacteria bacterium]
MYEFVERVSVWSASLMDKPGGLSNLLKCLDEADVDLDFIIARRAPEDPGNGVVFVSPLQGDREIRAASTLGFAISGSIAAVRVEGENEPGAAARLTDLIAGADINIRGFSGAVVGGRYIAYIGFDSPGDANRAASVIQQAE